jgi:hypothetical protein
MFILGILTYETNIKSAASVRQGIQSVQVSVVLPGSEARRRLTQVWFYGKKNFV